MTDIAKRKTKSAADKAEEAARCYELKLSGATHGQIVKATGLSHGTVQNRLDDAIKARVMPMAEEYRHTLMDRLERQYFYLQPKIRQGDVQANVAGGNLIGRMFEVSGLKSIDAPPPPIVVIDPGTSEAVQKMREENERRFNMIRGAIEGEVVDG